MPPVSPPSIPAESITPTFGHPPTEEEEQAPLTLKGNEEVIAPPAIKNSAETPGVLAGEINDQWKEFVQFAKRKKPPLASLLEHGYPLIINAELLEIGYPQKSFYLERMQEADNRSVLSTLCAEFFQRKMKVRVAGMNPQPLSPNLSGNGPEENHGRKNSKKNQQEEALNHPLVKEAINIFGGRVVEIKLL